MDQNFKESAQAEGAETFFGLPVHPVKCAGDVHHFITRVIERGEQAIVYNLNLHAVVLALRDEIFRNFVKHTHLVFCDGDGPRWGLRLMGKVPPPKMATTRWIYELADYCASKRYRLFLLGGRPGVAAEAARILCRNRPGLEIVGTRDGYFDREGEENEEVLRKIRESRPDILMVCLGMPLQEKWIEANWKRVPVHVFLKGGGVFDYVTGRLGKVPAWMIRLQLEWLFRILEEPGRLWRRYAFDIPYFLWRVLLCWVRGR